MDDRLAFVRAQLDDDERVAQGMDGACWHVEYCDDAGPAFHHRWSHARVLAEIDTKRRILDAYEATNRPSAGDDPMVAQGEQVMGERVIELLALSYADREGYREEWRP